MGTLQNDKIEVDYMEIEIHMDTEEGNVGIEEEKTQRSIDE